MDFRLPNFDEAKILKIQIKSEIAKVRLSAVCKQSFLSHMPLTLYKTFAWQTFASLRLFTCLVYVSTYCVPIAHLRQNKTFPLLYLGHAQIKKYSSSLLILVVEKRFMAHEQSANWLFLNTLT